MKIVNAQKGVRSMCLEMILSRTSWLAVLVSPPAANFRSANVIMWRGRDVHGQYASVGFCLMRVHTVGFLNGATLTEFQASTDLLLET